MQYPTTTRLFIHGQWRDGADAKTLPVLNPANGQQIGHLAYATRQDLDDALASAQQGFDTWRTIPAVERAVILRRAAQLIRERAESIASLITQEQGKPLPESRFEANAAAEIIEWFADEGVRVYGRIVPSRDAAVQQLVVKDPVGVVAAFTPWNFPLNQVVLKLAAALAAGCSIIVKAPEETPASPAELFRALADAGLPAGVANLVYGNPAEISGYLIPHPAVRKVTFTGSTPVGKQLAGLAGQHMKRVTMELGGHAPVIIAEDADVELAIRALGTAKFRNAGQTCISPTRFLVHEKVRAAFTAGLVRWAEGLRPGNGLDETTQIGPLANARRVTAVETLIEEAIAKGAKLLTGGKRLGQQGNFYAPTVLDDVPLDARIFNEEPFGPVALIRGFTDLEEAIGEANRLDYGLAAYAFSRSAKTIHQLSQRIETGMLWVNQPMTPSAELPFGGVKDSGYGTEGGPEAVEAYLNIRAISITHA
ncbi:NAD-dependent succinate-semialdehyde dehydrogenase [Enterobacter sp. Ap-1006]|uniref:NAD-dependent succinate-semialdehyde dehydrogenase n=1 Tax=Enterobacter sp. Ap-1006 TaxID=2608345 RepID=UPI00141FFE2B|nr:NAD-dependent succinate-semialdehyde dehydrogenase [Enterobacter sp. Ap-1006]NIF49125.1 NAD-dependent succinate-semialdehyde dehydrogenase [Enterobacter sp. Ap-1006]